MVIFIVLIGMLNGKLLTWASDYLPRFSANYQSLEKTYRFSMTPALWQLTVAFLSPKRVHQKWLPLHAGMEALSAVAFTFLYMRYGTSSSVLFYATIFSFFLLIALIDIKYRLVLNVLIYPAIVVVVLGQVLLATNSVLSLLLGGGLAFGIFYLTARLKPGDLGGGDVKLATLIGLAFGFPGVLWALIAGAGSGAVMAVILLSTHPIDEKRYFAYAPFLCLGAIIALLYVPFLTTL